MREKNIYDTVYSLLKEKPKCWILYLFIFLFFLFVIFLAFVKIKQTHIYYGKYSCKKTCTIETAFTIEDVKEVNEENTIIIQNQEYPLKIVSFKEIEYQSETSSVLENVVLEVPKLSFYDNQLVEIRLFQKEKNFLQILWDTLKGGDES